MGGLAAVPEEGIENASGSIRTNGTEKPASEGTYNSNHNPKRSQGMEES